MMDTEQANRIEAMLRVLLDAQRPHITFSEIQQRLGHNNSEATRQWLKRHKLQRVGPRAYRFIDFINAATRPHK